MKIEVPNAEIIFNDDILHEIKSLLREAQPAETVYLVTPYVRFDTRIREAIEEARGNKADIKFIIRSDADHSIEDVNWLIKNRVEILQVKNLHAKVYVSPKMAVIASMNLHTFSGSESQECGVKIIDTKTISKLTEAINKWISQATVLDAFSVGKIKQPRDSKDQFVAMPTHQTAIKVKGFCIRCSTKIVYNPKYPLCDEHYKIWEKYSDENYPEKVCHRCGKPELTALSKMPSYGYPLCKRCYQETAKK